MRTVPLVTGCCHGTGSRDAGPVSDTDKVVFASIFLLLVAIAVVGNLWWKWSYAKWKARKEAPPTHEPG